ncbi:phage P2 family tail protein [Campylobacter iguaniorum]|uniref:phage tail protein I n=1 Tax=Campylobacter iguaniorum TaxID=1244531 RepID=UPI00073A0452|nr:phage tail protein I [Campylobacter iguaniorum]ALV25046.1 phage P2 family tail protein [Campylobacter iguaniorum]
MRSTSLIPSFEPTKLHAIDTIAKGLQDRLNADIKIISNLANPQTCDAKFLPYLAFAYGVDFWSDKLSTKEKRDLISNSFLLHKTKGTVFVLERVFEILGLDANVQEWFSYGGKPYHFKLEVQSGLKSITLEQIKELEAKVEIYKNVRSVLESITINLSTFKAFMNVGSTMISGESLEIYPYQTPQLQMNSFYSFGVVFGFSEIININLDLKNIDN